MSFADIQKQLDEMMGQTSGQVGFVVDEDKEEKNEEEPIAVSICVVNKPDTSS